MVMENTVVSLARGTQCHLMYSNLVGPCEERERERVGNCAYFRLVWLSWILLTWKTFDKIVGCLEPWDYHPKLFCPGYCQHIYSRNHCRGELCNVVHSSKTLSQRQEQMYKIRGWDAPVQVGWSKKCPRQEVGSLATQYWGPESPHRGGCSRRHS